MKRFVPAYFDTVISSRQSIDDGMRVFSRKTIQRFDKIGSRVVDLVFANANLSGASIPRRRLQIYKFIFGAIIAASFAEPFLAAYRASHGDHFTSNDLTRLNPAAVFIDLIGLLAGVAMMSTGWRTWRSTDVRDLGGVRYVLYVVMAVFVTTLIRAWKSDVPLLPSLLVSAVCLLLAFVSGLGAVLMSVRHRLFGTSVLAWQGGRLQRGGVLRGEIRTNRLAMEEGDAPFVVTLLNYGQRWATPMGRAGSTGGVTVREFYRHSLKVSREELHIVPDGIAVPISFSLPARAQSSGWKETWRLDIERPMPGISYAASFLLEVETPAADASSTHHVDGGG